MPVVSARMVTEIQALEILTGVHAVHVASGGSVGARVPSSLRWRAPTRRCGAPSNS